MERHGWRKNGSLREKLALNESDAYVHAHLGHILMELGRNNEAITELNLAIEKAPVGESGWKARNLAKTA